MKHKGAEKAKRDNNLSWRVVSARRVLMLAGLLFIVPMIMLFMNVILSRYNHLESQRNIWDSHQIEDYSVTVAAGYPRHKTVVMVRQGKITEVIDDGALKPASDSGLYDSYTVEAFFYRAFECWFDCISAYDKNYGFPVYTQHDHAEGVPFMEIVAFEPAR